MTIERTESGELRRLSEEIRFLSELARIMASTTQLQPVLDWIVDKTTRMLGAEEGTLRLFSTEEPGAALHTVVRRKASGQGAGSWPASVNFSLMGHLTTADYLATADLREDSRFPALRGAPDHLRAVLAVPLRVDGQNTGLLAVTESHAGRRWSDSEIQLLSIVAMHSAGAIEQARLRAESLAKQELEERTRRLEHELARARETQMALVPSAALTTRGWEITGRVFPARAVGGDAFDYGLFDDTRVGLALADVAGKGVPAALLVASLVASLRAICNGRRPLEEAVAALNLSVLRAASPGAFATLFVAELDTSTGLLRFVNAGHTPAFVHRASGGVEALEKGGLPLGFLPDAEYEAGEVRLGDRDALLVYSDGVTEALDPRGRQYGEERLRDVWRRAGALAAEAALAEVLADVNRFRGEADPSDDLTLLVAARSRND